MYALVQTHSAASNEDITIDLAFFSGGPDMHIEDATARGLARRWAKGATVEDAQNLMWLASNKSFDTEDMRTEVLRVVKDADQQEALIDWLDRLEAQLQD